MMDERAIKKLLAQERQRWFGWGHEDWREMIEATPDDEDGELFFYLAPFGGEAFPVEVVCFPDPDGAMEISLIVTIEENGREAEAAWMVYADGEKEMLVETTDRREGDEEGDE